MNLQDFAKDMKKEANKLRSFGRGIVISTGLTLVDELIARSPVDTSKFLSNWVVSVDRPSNTLLEAYNRGFAGSSEAISAGQARNAARAAIQSYKHDRELWISNLTPYGPRLDAEGGNTRNGKARGADFVAMSLEVATVKIEGLRFK